MSSQCQPVWSEKKGYKKVSLEQQDLHLLYIIHTHTHSVVIIEESQPVKNRNLSRLIANLSLQNWPSARNSVYCFSTVFPLLQQQEVLSIHNLPWLGIPLRSKVLRDGFVFIVDYNIFKVYPSYLFCCAL